MRKIVESTLLSLDGVLGTPHIWASAYFGEEAQRDALKRLEASDAMLMGRRTYEIFQSIWAEREGPYVDRINSMKKYVFSNTLANADWNNSEIVRGDPVEAVTRLKQQDGAPLMMYGHGRLVEALLGHRLLDEIRLWMHPLFVGKGQRIVQDGEVIKMELVETALFSTGVVVLAYRPILAANQGDH